jgi:hypothetical protein
MLIWGSLWLWMSCWAEGISKLLLARRFHDLQLLVLVQLLLKFSAKNPLFNSHQAHKIAAHPVHHLPMGLPDDNPSSFGDHYGFGCHAGLEG